MRNNRVIQAAVILMVTVMVSLNIRLLISNRAEDDIEFEVNCRQVFQGFAQARPVNLTDTWWQWRELNTSKARALGYHRGRKGFLTIGVPSIKRENGMEYLMKTLSSLIDKTNDRDKAETIILVFLCDLDQDYNKEVLAEVSSKYLSYVDMGFIHIMQASPDAYPALEGLKLNFKDSPERVQWRAKQVVDFAFMFQYSSNLSMYYVQLEDDVVAAPAFVPAIRDYIRKQKTHWAVLEFSELGFIGKLFRSSDLPKLTKFLMTFYEEQPVDWLIRYYRMAMTQTKVLLRKPTLFQHVGLTSSFDTSKQNKLQDRFFDSGDKKWRSDDPPGSVYTDLHPYQGNTPELAYGSGSGYFWAKDPKPGEAFYIVFEAGEKLNRVVVETGHPEHQNDFLRNGTLEASPKLLRIDGQKVTCADWRVIGFASKGSIDAQNLQQKLGGRHTKCLKVTVTVYQPQWMVINQVAVFVVKDLETTNPS